MDIDELFQRYTQQDLDAEMVAAGQTLVKVAEENGVDLSKLSGEEIADLMLHVIKTSAEEPEEEKEEAKEEKKEAPPKKDEEKKDEEKKASMITHIDVTREILKMAAQEGTDLLAFSNEEYQEIFNKTAALMTDPSYHAMRAAEAEAYEKIAQFDGLGRVMARSMVDELQKLSALSGQQDDMSAKLAGIKEKIMGAAKSVANAERGASARIGEMVASKSKGVGKRVSDAVHKGIQEGGNYEQVRDAAHASVGRKILGAGAATAATGTAVGVAAKRRSNASKANAEPEAPSAEKVSEALELSIRYLQENGYDEESIAKFASLYIQDDAADDQDEIADLSVRMLKHAGVEL